MMSFEEIETRRLAAGLTRKAVYDRAQVDSETWRRLAKGSNEPNVRTLKKLSAALVELETEKGQGDGTN